MNVAPFPRPGLTARGMFARNHRDPVQWGIFAAAAGAAAMAGVCAGSFWVALAAYSTGGIADAVARAVVATLTRRSGDGVKV